VDGYKTRMTDRVWFITGASSGIGRALGEAVLKTGDRVVLTARDPRTVSDLVEHYGAGRARAIALDVGDAAQVAGGVDAAVDAFGTIDVLVNNAGYYLVGAVEEMTDAELGAQLDTNFLGAFRVTQQVLPHMRRAGRGHIVNISSVCGAVGFAGTGAYSASKFAMEGMSEALAHEVKPWGIKVTVVQPGAFRTEIEGRNLRLAAVELDAYRATAGATRIADSQLHGNQVGDPAKAAVALIALVDAPDVPLRLVLGADALAAVRAKLSLLASELDAWEQVTLSTSFDRHGAADSCP
jgi:NAD(P)-dependent dehydrogenase (short-subunit alcohol dehydrogenase family)